MRFAKRNRNLLQLAFGAALACLFVFVLPASSAAQVVYPLDVTGYELWTFNVPVGTGGRCHPCPNPDEQAASGDVNTPGGPGVQLVGASNSAQCCSCAARTRSWSTDYLDTTANATRFQGTWFAATRDMTTFTVATMRVELLLDGVVVANQIFGETRASNNCAGGQPVVALASGSAFDIAMDPVFGPNVVFNQVRVSLMTYACVNGTNSITVSGLQIQSF
jgi:hypothetical protein